MNKQKMVTTVSGNTLPISLCKKYPNGWYSVGDPNIENSGDCYLIGDKYYRFETGSVVYDHSISKYTLLNSSLIPSIVGFQDENTPILGYMSEQTDEFITLVTGKKYQLLSEKLIENNLFFRERLKDGVYYHIHVLEASEFNKIATVKQEYKTSLPYDSSGVMDLYLKQYQDLDVTIEPSAEIYSKLLKERTFGLEFETVAGIVPDKILKKTALIPLRDGSIPGIEYVTIPLSEAKGVQTVINAVKELKKRTIYNESCALHLHIGNIPRSKEFILAFFKVTCAIQEEMFALFPLYKKYNFKIKNKNYSKPYDIFNLISRMDSVINNSNIDFNFNILFQYLAMGEPFEHYSNDLRNVKVHPADREGRAKWHINTRYHWINFIPLIFGNKSTVEFRIHTPTFDTDKIINFLFINSLIVNYVIDNTQAILTSKYDIFGTNPLREIINNQIRKSKELSSSQRDNLLEELLSYIENRNKYIYNRSSEHNISPNEDDFKHRNYYIKWDSTKASNVSNNPFLKRYSVTKPSPYKKADIAFLKTTFLSGDEIRFKNASSNLKAQLKSNDEPPTADRFKEIAKTMEEELYRRRNQLATNVIYGVDTLNVESNIKSEEPIDKPQSEMPW